MIAVRSPVYSHVTTSQDGLHVIRGFGLEKEFIAMFDSHQDTHTASWYLYTQVYRWFGFYLSASVSIYIAGCTIAAMVIPPGSIDPGLLGISLMYVVNTFMDADSTIRRTVDIENMMTSVERILEYQTLDQEALEHTDLPVPPEWPTKGTLCFDHVDVFYTTGKLAALKDICFKIEHGEKIGIVGRTGAGKSTLLSALLRLVEPCGHIWIDGVDITKLGLTDLRRNITAIPQDPVLFSGTLRHNLDPNSEYTDEQIWDALNQVHLGSKALELTGGLCGEMAEAGDNFSIGQRQLVCLARAILKKNKIIVIDEATANVDHRTDMFIQKTIHDKFQSCTVICIAHRLNTIIDTDKVLVLDHGQIQQFDHPHLLLKEEEGLFYQMVMHTGQDTANSLITAAATSYHSKHH